MITANLFFGGYRGPGHPMTPDWDSYRLLVIVPMLARKLIPEQGYDDKSPPLKAYVNHGVWLVKCECGGHSKVWDEGWVMCCNCLNSRNKHKYRRTAFPRARQSIERLLLVRSLDNRNWNDPFDIRRLGRQETVSDLEAENEKHKPELLEVR